MQGDYHKGLVMNSSVQAVQDGRGYTNKSNGRRVVCVLTARPPRCAAESKTRSATRMVHIISRTQPLLSCSGDESCAAFETNGAFVWNTTNYIGKIIGEEKGNSAEGERENARTRRWSFHDPRPTLPRKYFYPRRPRDLIGGASPSELSSPLHRER